MKTKSFYIQVDIAVVTVIIIINLLLSQYNKKYEILDITSEPNSSVPICLLFLDILSMVTLAGSWWLIVYRNKKGIKTISILTIIVLILTTYWWGKA